MKIQTLPRTTCKSFHGQYSKYVNRVQIKKHRQTHYISCAISWLVTFNQITLKSRGAYSPLSLCAGRAFTAESVGVVSTSPAELARIGGTLIDIGLTVQPGVSTS